MNNNQPPSEPTQYSLLSRRERRRLEAQLRQKQRAGTTFVRAVWLRSELEKAGHPATGGAAWAKIRERLFREPDAVARELGFTIPPEVKMTVRAVHHT